MLCALVTPAVAMPVHIYKSPQPPPAFISITTRDEARLESAKAFVDELIHKAISFLANGDLTHNQRKHKFEKLLLNRFDMKTIARFSLGRYWRTATTAQKKEYFKLFEHMILDVYSKRFGDYKGQKIDIRKARPEARSDILVTSFILQDNGTEIQLDWRVRYKEGRYRVVDVIVEGVSMALTQRADFASVIQRGGGEVSVLLTHLRR
jgi:phospholipid transport system substrate-binding protein